MNEIGSVYLIPIDFREEIKTKDDVERLEYEIGCDVQNMKNRMRELVFCTDFSKIAPKDKPILDWLEEELDYLIERSSCLLNAYHILQNLKQLDNFWEQSTNLENYDDEPEEIPEEEQVPVQKRKSDLNLN